MKWPFVVMVCFHCPIPIPRPTPIQIQKSYTGTHSDGHSNAKSQWKLVKFNLIGTNIGAKMGTVAIGIRIGTCIGIGIGSLETLLHIIIIAIFIGIRIGIGVGQWKHTIRVVVCPWYVWICMKVMKATFIYVQGVFKVVCGPTAWHKPMTSCPLIEIGSSIWSI